MKPSQLLIFVPDVRAEAEPYANRWTTCKSGLSEISPNSKVLSYGCFQELVAVIIVLPVPLPHVWSSFTSGCSNNPLEEHMSQTRMSEQTA